MWLAIGRNVIYTTILPIPIFGVTIDPASIAMAPFKLLSGRAYSDTDSIFTTDKLDSSVIGKELGLMKDELEGKLIQEGFFLGIKQYGYWYKDGYSKIERSVFAGVSRNSLSNNEVPSLLKGETIIKERGLN